MISPHNSPNLLPDIFYPVAGSAMEVSLAVGGGARFVQLRFKSDDQVQIRKEVRTALAICRQNNVTLVINDYWKTALEEGAKYVHLGQEDLQTAELQSLRQHQIKFGISTHNPEELELALKAEPDYIALGPIWETTLKIMPYGPQGLERVTEWARRIHPLPLVTIGGITLSRCLSCVEAGAASVAAVSDIFCHPDPVAQVQAWRRTLGRSYYE